MRSPADVYEMNTGSILIVDDDPMYLRLARFLLDAEGLKVHTAVNAEDAQAIIASHPPQLILMDVQLPGIDGLELTRRLKADPATRDIVVLALSGYSVNGYEEKARHAGCDGCITKPINTSTFANIVKQHLGARQELTQIVHTSDYHDLLTQLRNDFLVEGAEETERVLKSLNNKFDLQRVLRLVHRWAGIGGTLGMPEISHKARQIKQSLEIQPPASSLDRMPRSFPALNASAACAPICWPFSRCFRSPSKAIAMCSISLPTSVECSRAE